MKNDNHDIIHATYKEPVIQNGKTSVSRLPEILFITSYPPRECGLATYSQDLIKALSSGFSTTFQFSICPLESEFEKHVYEDKVRYILDTDNAQSFKVVAETINGDDAIRLVAIQHEFGLFERREADFMALLSALKKPVVMAFHTVLPNPSPAFKDKVANLCQLSAGIVVMTRTSRNILVNEYAVPAAKVSVIPHGTHLVNHTDKKLLKEKYGFTGRKVLSTFGLLSSGKGMETTLEALPAIIENDPQVLFLIIGKTHPGIVKREGEKYREMLEAKIAKLKLQHHVRFINRYIRLPELLEYLQLTDIYLFTSRDPHQAVSGTFSYAISSGCPVISTPIPHAKEVLQNNDLIVDFDNPRQLAEKVNLLLGDEKLRTRISEKGLHYMASTSWENAAIAHAHLFNELIDESKCLDYDVPSLRLDHLKRLTTDFGMIQFSKFDQPDIESGYTLDDNARAMIAFCNHFSITRDTADIPYIRLYLSFIKHCLQPEGYFLNYVDKTHLFTEQNNTTNLADANGRAIWALGYLISMKTILPHEIIAQAEGFLQRVLPGLSRIYSTRAMAFAVKGLYYRNLGHANSENQWLIGQLANRLVQMYRHESEGDWKWFESYLTYANSIIPEALLCAWCVCGDPVYKEISKASFDFLLSQTFRGNCMQLISNKAWMHKGEVCSSPEAGGEQPIDVAYTILALQRFHDIFREDEYMYKTQVAFSWFLGNNRLKQMVYNPCTTGCYDGLELHNANLNQGAESTVSYILARLSIESLAGRKMNGPAALTGIPADNMGNRKESDLQFA